VILRYGLEKRLVAGELAVADIPEAWDEAMQRLLGIDTRGDHTDGALQDVHWPVGLVGYFPCYTIGALYAAQWFAAIRRTTPDLDARVAAGDTAPVFDWMEENVWRQGSRWTTEELVQRASGGALDAANFRRHIESRYL
jgi:carboxypeptidase Taq